MTKPGYKTSEHALTWAVVALSAVAVFRGGNSLDRLSSLLAPAIASAAYSHARGRAKSAIPFDARQLLREQLLEAFKTSSRIRPASASADARAK